jgi:hypothetical protein
LTRDKYDTIGWERLHASTRPLSFLLKLFVIKWRNDNFFNDVPIGGSANVCIACIILAPLIKANHETFVISGESDWPWLGRVGECNKLVDKANG